MLHEASICGFKMKKMHQNEYKEAYIPFPVVIEIMLHFHKKASHFY